MNIVRKSDKLLRVLHKAGWSIGDTAFGGPGGLTWLVYGTQGGYELRAENSVRTEAWEEACRRLFLLGERRGRQERDHRQNGDPTACDDEHGTLTAVSTG
jgi:hypothetical protein